MHDTTLATVTSILENAELVTTVRRSASLLHAIALIVELRETILWVVAFLFVGGDGTRQEPFNALVVAA